VSTADETKENAGELEALLAAWRADPTDPDVLDQLEAVTRGHDEWLELLERTGELLDAETIPARALAYAEAMVGWLMREVSRPDLAQHYLEHVRRVDSTHWLVHLFQAAKYQEHGDARRELEALDRAALSAKRATDRARIHVLMAQRMLADRTANPVEAKKHLRKAHELAPKSMDALRGLEQIHLAEGDVTSLAAVLEEQVEATDSDQHRSAILMRLAELHEKEFLKPELAAERFEQAFALDPNQDDAIAGLERCFAATRRWADLVRVLEAAIVLVEDDQLRAERLLRLAEVYESRLGDFAGAARAFEQLQTILGDDETLIGELARLSEKMGDYAAAAGHHVRLAGLAPDAATRARMHVAAGQLVAPHDATAARAEFELAITFDPTNAAAHGALLADARAAGDWMRVVDYLETRVAATTAPRLQAQIYAELGHVRRELGDESAALSAWEAAARLDPTHEGAACALIDVYVAAGRWADAAPFCDLVLHAAERDDDPERLYVARCQAFAIAWHFERRERALDLILGAFASHPEAAYAKESLIACAYSLREDTLVLQATEALLGIALEGLPRAALIQLAETLALIGEAGRATSIFDGVLASDPNDADALTGLAGLRAARGESLAAWTLKRQLAEGTPDDASRFSLLVETADGLAREAKRPDLAADVYEQARAIRPKDHALLHKLLAQYQALERWANVFDVLRAIVDSDDDDRRRAKVVMTMASIAQSKLGPEMRMKAISLYDDALELDPTRLDAFERLVRLLTEAKDAQGLAYMYKRMIARANRSGDARLEHALALQLGLIYRDRLHDRDKAVAAFRSAAAIQPDDEQALSMLRELLTVSGRPDDAVAVTLARVLESPLDPAPYPALFDLLAQLGRVDRAWCTASAMAHVGAAHPAATSLHRSRPPPPIERIAGTLGPDGWRQLVHRDLDPTLTTIFEIMAQAAVQVRLSAMGLRERLAHPGPALKEPQFVLHDVTRASHILGVAAPRVFVGSRPPAITVAVTKPLSLLVHRESLPAFPRNLLAFWIGKRLIEITPPLLARSLFRSITELKNLVAAAARIVDGKTLERSDAALRSQIGRGELESLSQAVMRARANEGAPLDVRRWSQLADLSASRAGLVLTGDVDTARLALMQESQSPGDLGPREQMRELTLFFLSDEYARIRAALNVSLSR
jgi:tetratricopeptide (TPR) repeat protein